MIIEECEKRNYKFIKRRIMRFILITLWMEWNQKKFQLKKQV
jgi:hypothetical protein